MLGPAARLESRNTLAIDLTAPRHLTVFGHPRRSSSRPYTDVLGTSRKVNIRPFYIIRCFHFKRCTPVRLFSSERC
jgi:hypothetical protein